MKTQPPISNAKITCAYCSRGPAEGVSLKRVKGLKLYYCVERKGFGWRRECK